MPSLKLPDLPSKTDILSSARDLPVWRFPPNCGAGGIATVTVDKVAEGANTSRAAVVHARTLEVLEPLGAARAAAKLPLCADQSQVSA
jgi:hypothetical protein